MTRNNEILEKLKVFYQKYKLILWPISSGLACLIIIFFVIIPQFTEYLGIKSKINDLQKRSDSLEVKAQELEELDDVNVKRNLQIAFTVLPTSPDIPQVMIVLQDIIGKSDLSLKNTNYSTSVNTSAKGSFQLTVSVVGQLSSIRRFLINLKEAPLVFQIESIKAQFNHDGSLVEAEIPIQAFYESNIGVSNALDQPIPKLSNEELNLMSNLAARAPSLSYDVEELADLGTIEQASDSAVPLGKADPFN